MKDDRRAVPQTENGFRRFGGAISEPTNLVARGLADDVGNMITNADRKPLLGHLQRHTDMRLGFRVRIIRWRLRETLRRRCLEKDFHVSWQNGQTLVMTKSLSGIVLVLAASARRDR